MDGSTVSRKGRAFGASAFTLAELADFERQINSTGPGECWPWTGSATDNGYGRFRVRAFGERVRAHRAAYAIANGPVAAEIHVYHLCGSPLCCNPAHLAAGDVADEKRARAKARRGPPERLDDGSWRVPLTRGHSTLVDDSDLERVLRYNWTPLIASRQQYAHTTIWHPAEGRERTVRLHRYLLRVPPDMHVDHINHDGLDNRRVNLRVCTPAENAKNRRHQTDYSSSIYKGVASDGRGGWGVHAALNGEMAYLGYFKDELEAARAYDEFVILNYGEFAYTNAEMYPDHFPNSPLYPFN